MKFLPHVAFILPLLSLSAVAAMPNVVLLSVDTLRADRLGAYGYPLDTSPNLDKFAGEALVFDDAICDIPLTGPSMGAVLSARFPRMTGATRNGLPVPASVPLVAEQFQKAGYHTFCVQSNWTLKVKLSGLGRGFDIYDDDFHQKRWGVIKAERDGDEVTRLALKYLENRAADKPFFAWIHYTEPHAPYKFHRGFDPANYRRWRMGKQERVRARYDSEVAFTDNEIQKVLDALPENTHVLFMSDHGESLYEHGYLGHGRRIHHTIMRIPLMIRAEGVTPGRSAVPAQGIDVGPTLLGLAGLPRVPGMLGLDLLNDTIPDDRPRIFETYGGAVPNLPGAKAAMADAGPIRQGAVHEGWKIILHGEKSELFYLPEDGGELLDRSGEMPEKVEALRELIRRWEAATPAVKGSAEGLNADDWAALESLGYLD